MAFDSFRGFDLTGKKKKIENAFNRVPPKSADDVPVILNTPCYFGSGTIMPQGYWDDPKVMLDYQQEGAHQHLMMVDDDAIPYFMPWCRTGVLASAFGCPMRDAQGNGDDPAVIGHLLNRPAT